MQLEIRYEEPENRQYETPLLFIHGAWHGAWCWDEYFLAYFAEQGFSAHALSLRGHGKSEGKLRWASIHDYVADVAQVASAFDTPPILIGHSMGGYVVQKYLEKHQALAGVLVATIPAQGIRGFFLRAWLKHPLTMLKTTLSMNPYHIINTPQKAQDEFFSASMPLEQVTRYHQHMHSESFRIIFDSLFLNLPNPKKIKTPLLMVSAENDKVFSLKEQEQTAKAYGIAPIVFPNMAHDMMLEAEWQSVADTIIEWIGGQQIT